MNIGLTYTARSLGSRSFELDDTEEEFDSPETIAEIAQALSELGHEVELLGDGEPLVRRLLDGPRPELVFNIAEGTGGGRSREARVPALLEMLGIPFTGSDPLALAATLDKDVAKRLVAATGVATPGWVLFDGDFPTINDALDRLELPAIVKPSCEGSSKGILRGNLVNDRAQLVDALARVHARYHQPALAEEFIDGDELTVGLVGNAPVEVLGIMRVVPRISTGTFVYSLEVKRDWQRQVRYECPAALAADDIERVRTAAIACWRALGCRDVARIDFRLRRGVPYFLEANPLPGLSSTSGDLVLLAGGLGIEYRELIGRIVDAALARRDSQIPCHRLTCL